MTGTVTVHVGSLSLMADTGVKVAAEAARVMHLGKALSREWRSIEIKAERKWGELLGEAEPKNRHSPDAPSVTTGNASPPSERKAAHEARKLYAIPESVFEEYVEQTEVPTKAGLLRAAENVQALTEPDDERRMGELLPPAQPGKRSDLEPLDGVQRLTQAQFDARKAARALAAVPQDVFDEYLATRQRYRRRSR